MGGSVGSQATYHIAAPILFGMDRNNPAIGTLSNKLAAKPNAGVNVCPISTNRSIVPVPEEEGRQRCYRIGIQQNEVNTHLDMPIYAPLPIATLHPGPCLLSRNTVDASIQRW